MVSSFEITSSISSSRIKIKNYLFNLEVSNSSGSSFNNSNNSNNSNNRNNNSIKYNMIMYGNVIESKYNNNHRFNIIRIYHYLNQKDNNIINHFTIINKPINYYYLIKTCSSYSIFNSNKCKEYSLNLIELNTFNSIEIKSKVVKLDNYNSNSIPGFDDSWFKKKLFDVETQRLLVQGFYDDSDGTLAGKDSFQLVNSFVHLPDPYKTCEHDQKVQPYCPYRQFPFYVRDSDRCLTQKGCIPLGVCLSIVKPSCIEGYQLAFYRGESNGCFKYYCDFNLLDQIVSNY